MFPFNNIAGDIRYWVKHHVQYAKGSSLRMKERKYIDIDIVSRLNYIFNSFPQFFRHGMRKAVKKRVKNKRPQTVLSK